MTLPSTPEQIAAQLARDATDLGAHADTFNYWRLRRPDVEFVYLLTEWEHATGNPTGYAKVGRAIDPLRRLRALRTANPRHLQLAGLILGGARIETMLHKRWAHFAYHPSSREWFRGDCVKLLPVAFAEIDRRQRERGPLEPAAQYEQDVQIVSSWDLTPLLSDGSL